MKSLIIMSTFLLSILPCSIEANGQDQNLVPADPTVSMKIDQETQEKITDVVYGVVQKYGNTANFWDETFETFDDDKYAEFMALFGGTATVVNDIGSVNTILHYSDYAALVFKTLQIKGVPFELENVEIESIEIDDTGFYVANVAFEKVVYVALTKKDKFYQIKNGKKIKLNMKIDMPDYLISDARIQSIHVPPKKGLVQSLNGWYLGVMNWPVFKWITPKKEVNTID